MLDLEIGQNTVTFFDHEKDVLSCSFSAGKGPLLLEVWIKQSKFGILSDNANIHIQFEYLLIY